MTSLARRPIRQQNLIAVTAALLLIAAMAGVLWGFDRIQDREIAALGAEQQRLTALLLAVRGQKQLAQARQQLEALGEDRESLLPGDTPILAGAALQNRLTEAIESDGGRVESMLLLPTEPEAALERISVRFVAVMDMTQLQRLLFALETGQPLLFVEGFQSETLARRGAAGGEEQSRPMLRVTLTVSGYLASPAREGTS